MSQAATSFLDHWQTLIGAALGAAVPISLWFMSQWYQSHNERQERTKILLKIIGLNMISAVEAYDTIAKFLKEKVLVIIEKIDQVNPGDYFLGTAFMPLFSVHPIKIEVLEINSGSGYVDNLMIEITKMSMDFQFAVDDVRKQFETTIADHRELCLSKTMPPDVSSRFFKESLEQFEDVTRREMLENNIKVYVKLLAKGQAVISEFNKKGLFLWRLKFLPHFKYFKNKKSMEDFNSLAHERIDSILEEKINERIAKVESLYRKNA